MHVGMAGQFYRLYLSIYARSFFGDPFLGNLQDASRNFYSPGQAGP